MRKPFFKAVVAGMASVAMIAGMSACGRSANNADSDSDAVKTIDSSKATGDLTIWAMGNEGDLLGDFVKGFEKENPDVKVKVHRHQSAVLPYRHRRDGWLEQSSEDLE